MQYKDMQNYLEDFTVEGLDKLSPFIQDAFYKVKYAFNSRLNFKDCSFTADFAKEELSRFVSMCIRIEDDVQKYKSDVIRHLNNLSLTKKEFEFRFKEENRKLNRKIPDFVLWYYRYLRRQYNVNVQYTIHIDKVGKGYHL
jgi:hypothetical protein